jgi:hypothetical protein
MDRRIEDIYHSVSLVSLLCGVGNNAAWLVCLDANDRMKAHLRYNTRVAGGHTVGWYFSKVLKMYHDYERRLLNADTNKLFSVKDMEESVRRRYGSGITDRDYYEMWCGYGARVYSATRTTITSLVNKFRLSLASHGIDQAEELAWGLTAQSCLTLSCLIYEYAIGLGVRDFHVNESTIRQLVSQLSLKNITKVWADAMLLAEPKTKGIIISETEERNIYLGLKQLQEEWTDRKLIEESTCQSVDDFAELFRNGKELKITKAGIHQAFNG